MSDQQFDEFLDDARIHIDAEITSELQMVAPDFAALISIVGLSAETQFAGAPELVESDLPMLDEPDFDAVVAAARRLVEADVGARMLVGVPPVATPTNRREYMKWAVGLLAIAATLTALAIGLPRALQHFVDATHDEANQQPTQAEYNQREGETKGAAARVNPPRIPRSVPATQHTVAPLDDRTPEVVADAEPDPAKRAPKQTPQPAPESDDIDARVAELDAEAQTRWAAGDLSGAQDRFRTIIEIAGRRTFADLAYGDLFTLARQRKDEVAERELWVEYLDVFPKGRFAEDAWAGLCSHAATDEQSHCWSRYLAEFPNGIHAHTARALDGEPDREN